MGKGLISGLAAEAFPATPEPCGFPVGYTARRPTMTGAPPAPRKTHRYRRCGARAWPGARAADGRPGSRIVTRSSGVHLRDGEIHRLSEEADTGRAVGVEGLL